MSKIAEEMNAFYQLSEKPEVAACVRRETGSKCLLVTACHHISSQDMQNTIVYFLLQPTVGEGQNFQLRSQREDLTSLLLFCICV